MSALRFVPYLLDFLHFFFTETKMLVYISVAVVLLTTFWYLRRLFGVKEVTGGLHKEITLPYQESVELYHNATSSCSQKVRSCLYEAGVEFKVRSYSLNALESIFTILLSPECSNLPIRVTH